MDETKKNIYHGLTDLKLGMHAMWLGDEQLSYKHVKHGAGKVMLGGEKKKTEERRKEEERKKEERALQEERARCEERIKKDEERRRRERVNKT